MTRTDASVSLESPQGEAFAKHVAGDGYTDDDETGHHRYWPEDTDPEHCWTEFWVKRVWEGTAPTPEQIKAELYDYHGIMGDVAHVYDEVSRGAISKPTTRAFEVIRKYQEHLTEEYDATVEKLAFSLRSTGVRKFALDVADEDIESLADALMEGWYGYAKADG